MPPAKEAALALGATRWEMIRMAVLPYSRAGITGAAMLGLGRAIGETIAVTMVIGNSPMIGKPLFDQGYTLAAVIANEFGEAAYDSSTAPRYRRRPGPVRPHAHRQLRSPGPFVRRAEGGHGDQGRAAGAGRMSTAASLAAVARRRRADQDRAACCSSRRCSR